MIQLDDGYEAQVGDWERTRPEFGVPLEAIGRRIAEAGGTPGLWIAPFVAAHNSRAARDHPHWILRNHGGAPVGIGYTWGLRTRALDVSHPEVREFVRHTVQTAVQSWGFRYLKLDFLYAGAMIGERHDRSQTRAQAYSQRLGDIRLAAGPETYLVGCGGPLGPGIGIFDSMRVGPDVSIGWNPSYPGIPTLPRSDPEFPAVRNALRNALSRAHLHRRWWLNDADCVLLRPADAAGGRGAARRGLSPDGSRGPDLAHSQFDVGRADDGVGPPAVAARVETGMAQPGASAPARWCARRGLGSDRSSNDGSSSLSAGQWADGRLSLV